MFFKWASIMKRQFISTLHPYGWNHEKKTTKCVDNLLKTIFEFSKNHHLERLYINFFLNFWNKIYKFKVATTKISWKFTMFQKSFYMFKALKKNMWTSDFFSSKVIFPYQMFTKGCDHSQMKQWWWRTQRL